MSDQPTARRFSPRKRSRLALGSIAVAGMSLGLSGCEDQPAEPLRFSSVEQCITAGYERPFCETSFQAAVSEHQETAPQYASAAACEAEWGAAGCERAGGGGVFMPLLTGFLVGQALNRSGDRSYYGYGGMGYYGSPIYRNRSGQAVTLTPGTGVNAPPRATPVNVGTTTVARSGFGGRGMARGGYGFGS